MVHLSREWKSASAVSALTALMLLSMIGCAATAVWLFWDLAPRVAVEESELRADISRAQAVSDGLVAGQVTIGLASNDYGELQEALNRSANAGHLTRAVIVNSANKIVAEIDLGNRQANTKDSRPIRGIAAFHMGELLPKQILESGRKIDIALGARNLGALIILAPSAPAPELESLNAARLRRAAMLMTFLSLVSAVTLGWAWLRAPSAGAGASAEIQSGETKDEIRESTLRDAKPVDKTPVILDASEDLDAAHTLQSSSDNADLDWRHESNGEPSQPGSGWNEPAVAKAEFRRRFAESRARRAWVESPTAGEREAP